MLRVPFNKLVARKVGGNMIWLLEQLVEEVDGYLFDGCGRQMDITYGFVAVVGTPYKNHNLARLWNTCLSISDFLIFLYLPSILPSILLSILPSIL